MTNYIITRKEVWNSGVLIEADSKEKALKLVAQGNGIEVDGLLEYSHRLNSDTWDVEEVSDISATKFIDEVHKQRLDKKS